MSRVFPISSCASAWGLCMHDPRCTDLDCPGHPAGSCSTCDGGPCPTPQACLRPLAELRPIERHLFTQRRFRLPSSRQAWARVVMAGTGIAGLFFILGAAGRHIGVL